MNEHTLPQSKFNLHKILSSPRWVIALVILLWGVCYLPALGARDLRLEEGRRATPAAEMVATGDFVVPRLYTEPYLNKPPMFFWIIAGVGEVLGDVDALAARIPSVASVLLGALMLLFFARRQLPLHVRAMAAIFFMATPIIFDKGTLGEIDATLAFVTFAAVCLIWNAFDHERGRFRFYGWIASGVMLAIATLIKGPGGLVQFYAMVIPFLLLSGRGRWKQIFSLGHLLMLILAIAPAIFWVLSMVNRAKIPLGNVLSIWGEQTGARNAVAALDLDHYLWFPPRTVGMLLPWVVYPLIAIVPAMRRRFMDALCEATPVTTGAATNADTQQRNLKDLWYFLLPAFPVLLAIFWIWPRGEPRYLAMAAFPVAVLAAMMLSALTAGIKGAEVQRHLANFACHTQLAVLVCAVGAAVAVFFVSPQGVVTVIVTAVICIVLAIGGFLVFLRSHPMWSPVLAAVGVAMVALCARGLLAGTIFPRIAESDSARQIHLQMDQLVPPDMPLYTTRIFSNHKGGTYYNVQFYLRKRTATGRRDPMPLATFADLPTDKTAIVILGEKEWDDLIRVSPRAVNLGVLFTPKGPAPLIVARVPN